MAVGRRILIGGSIHPLSPTEGKFRVKAVGVRPVFATPFVYRNAPRINEAGPFLAARDLPARLLFFSLGRRAAITDNEFA
jgi:hypothetical protein